MSARPDLMAKLEKLVDVDASMRAGHLVAADHARPLSCSERGTLDEAAAGDARVIAENAFEVLQHDTKTWVVRRGVDGAIVMRTLSNVVPWFCDRCCSNDCAHVVAVVAAAYIAETQRAEHNDLTPLRTYRAPVSVLQADGHSDADIFAPTVDDIEAVVCELDADPRKIAERILRIERALADLRTQFDAATVGAYK